MTNNVEGCIKTSMTRVCGWREGGWGVKNVPNSMTSFLDGNLLETLYSWMLTQLFYTGSILSNLIFQTKGKYHGLH